MQAADGDGKPELSDQINAFQLIGMSSSLDLSGFFENEVRVEKYHDLFLVLITSIVTCIS